MEFGSNTWIMRGRAGKVFHRRLRLWLKIRSDEITHCVISAGLLLAELTSNLARRLVTLKHAQDVSISESMPVWLMGRWRSFMFLRGLQQNSLQAK